MHGAMRGCRFVEAACLLCFACAPAPLVTTPGPATAPACPLEGCGPVAAAAPEADAACALGREPCGGMSAPACTERALALWAAADDGGAVACVARMLEGSCSQDDASACAFAGRLRLDGRGVAKDTEAGLRLLSRGCDGGVALACLVGAKFLGDASASGSGDESPDLQHRFEIEYACLSAQAEACFQAGVMFRLGQEGFPQDAANAVRQYTRGCNLGESRACNNLGDALAYGEGVDRDLGRAADTFAKACRLGEALGCANYAYRLEHGSGVARDVSRARALYKDACSTGSVYGCLHADLLAAQAPSVPRDPARALAHWEHDCERARSARACAFVGLLYDDGPDGLQRDETKSLQAMSRGCDLGETRACDWVRMHQD
jgi:TPR repeat protein